MRQADLMRIINMCHTMEQEIMHVCLPVFLPAKITIPDAES
jgi:hypothetical protein